MRYQAMLDVRDITDFRKLQPGQWLHAGTHDSRGRFAGVTKHQTIVVCWGRDQSFDRLRKLLSYAKDYQS